MIGRLSTLLPLALVAALGAGMKDCTSDKQASSRRGGTALPSSPQQLSAAGIDKLVIPVSGDGVLISSREGALAGMVLNAAGGVFPPETKVTVTLAKDESQGDLKLTVASDVPPTGSFRLTLPEAMLASLPETAAPLIGIMLVERDGTVTRLPSEAVTIEQWPKVSVELDRVGTLYVSLSQPGATAGGSTGSAAGSGSTVGLVTFKTKSGTTIGGSAAALEWNPFGSGATYRIALYDSDCHTARGNAEGLTATTLALDKTLADATYCAVVEAFAGALKLGSSLPLILTLDRTPPAAFDLTNGRPATTTDATPTVAWSAATGAKDYVVALYQTNCTTLVTTKTVTALTVDLDALADGAWCVKVTARDAAGNVRDATSAWSFTLAAGGGGGGTGGSTPGTFTITSPGATSSDTTPTIQWTASSGATAYDLRVLYGNCMGSETVSAPNLTAITYTVSSPIPSGFDYCIEITARDTTGQTLKVTKIFNLDSSRPATPTSFRTQSGIGFVDLSWSNQSTSFLVLRKVGSAVDFTPTDGVDYSGSGVNTGGNVSVYAGTWVSSYRDSTVANGTTYHYAVYAYDGSFAYSSVPARAFGTPTSSGAPILHVAYHEGPGAFYKNNSSGLWAGQQIDTGTWTESSITTTSTGSPRLSMSYSGTGHRFESFGGATFTGNTYEANTGGGEASSISRISDTNYLVVYTGAQYGVYATTGAGGSFAAPATIETNPATGTAPDNIATAVDALGGYHAVWDVPVSGVYEVHYASKSGASWSTPLSLKSYGGGTCDMAMKPDLAVDAAGKAHVVFMCVSGGMPVTVYATNKSGTWTYSTVAAGYMCSERASLALDAGGIVHFVHGDSSTCHPVYQTIALDGSVSSPVTLDSGGGSSNGYQVAVDSDGYVHVVYGRTLTSPPNEIRHATNRGGSWSSAPHDVVATLSGSPKTGHGIGISGGDGKNGGSR